MLQLQDLDVTGLCRNLPNSYGLIVLESFLPQKLCSDPSFLALHVISGLQLRYLLVLGFHELD